MYLSCATVITEYYNVSMNIVTWTGTIALGTVSKFETSYWLRWSFNESYFETRKSSFCGTYYPSNIFDRSVLCSDNGFDWLRVQSCWCFCETFRFQAKSFLDSIYRTNSKSSDLECDKSNWWKTGKSMVSWKWNIIGNRWEIKILECWGYPKFGPIRLWNFCSIFEIARVVIFLD